jgi:hypothetical protein
MAVRSAADSISHVFTAYSSAAITAAQVLGEFVCVAFGRIEGVIASAQVVGTVAGSDVLDILVNGVSIYTVVANRPTLLFSALGTFVSGQAQLRALRPGDVVKVIALSVGTTGHGRVCATIAIVPA